MAPELAVVGKPLPKIDAPAKVTGQTKYADDLALPRMLYGKLLRSPYPHAIIKGIDASEALKLPGVHALLTGQDLPIRFGAVALSQDETALAVGKVRYVGEPVAALAAVDEETAEEALKLIRVDYEPLPPIMSVEEALRPEGPTIHDWGNTHRTLSYEYGDIEEGFRQADYVREDVFFYQGSNHLALEEHAALAHYDPTADKLTLWSCTQSAHHVHRFLAQVLAMPPHKVRVIGTPVGGGFGGKWETFSHEICAAKLAMATGRPVKITLTREEVFYAHRGRHPAYVWVKTGVKKDGTHTAFQIKSVLDGGGYSGLGYISTGNASGPILSLSYKLPHFKFEGIRLYTNKPPCGPKRGHGVPQSQLAREVQVDKIAHDLGLDPLEMRLRQIMPADSVTVNFLHIASTGLRECLEGVGRASGWRQRHGKLPYGQGLGLACSCFVSGVGHATWRDEKDLPHTIVNMNVDRWGTVTVGFGTADIGQGSDTVMATIAAEVLGLRLSEVRVISGDTDLTPVDLGAFSSRITLFGGNAALDAAEKIAQALRRAAAAKLGVEEEALVLAGGRIYDRENPEVGLSFLEAARLAEATFGPLAAAGAYKPSLGTAHGARDVSPAYAFAACVAQVSVSPRTGEVKVEKIWLGHDCGRAINPLLVEGQAEGSIYMAVGEALMEEQSFRRGLHKAPSMLEYKSPTTLEMPEIETIMVESVDPKGPYGAKEAGEGPMVPVMPAILNALYDAVGIRIDEVPITPEKVLKALEEKAKGGDGRIGPKALPPVAFGETRRFEVHPYWRTGQYREE